MVTTINDVYLDTRRTLRQANIAGSDIEARELVCFALGMDQNTFFAKKREYLFDPKIKEIQALVERRLSGVPLQHITGRWEFYGLDFKVTEDTLIPRADTETLVDSALAFVNSREKARVLDLCCGTGCIGISITRFARNPISCMLADISEKALRVAKENIALNRVTNSVNVSICDALQPCPSVFGTFDLIVCNPPYIPTSEIPTLDIEVQNEPHLALDGGEDGLDLYRAICVNFRPAVREGGALMFEVGLSQHEDVRDIMLAAGFEDITIFKDLTGIERVVCGVVPYSIEPMEEELQELEMAEELASVEGENEEICPKNGTEENRTNVAEPVQM